MTALTADFPPRTNAAWVYDPPSIEGRQRPVKAGYFVEVLNHYNAQASAGARIGLLYVYGGDMEISGPRRQVTRCQLRDFRLNYSDAAQHDVRRAARSITNASVNAYASRLVRSFESPRLLLSPVIDGTISEAGSLSGFDELTRHQAQVFADEVASRVCADPAVDGIQFDLEPFNVTRRAGQYHFYKRISQNFAARRCGCVDALHPYGRFFSIFTTPNRLRPRSASARHIHQIMRVAGNGYLIASLYDLEGTPAGQQTHLPAYRRQVQRETQRMRQWADGLGVKYQFAVPASASVHEYGACRGQRCQPSQSVPSNDPETTQLAYLKAAMEAIRASGALDDTLYLGVALWAWSTDIRRDRMQFLPAEPSNAAKRYIINHLQRR